MSEKWTRTKEIENLTAKALELSPGLPELDEPPDSEGHNVCRVCGCPDRIPFPINGYWAEPDLCNECVGKRRAEETRGARYMYNGFEIFMSKGLGDQYGTFRQSGTGGLHRIKSPAMPMVATAKEAQVNLDAWAEAKGLRAVKKAEAS